jgi:hypothetical protein
MWLAVAGITILAAIGFCVLGLTVQWREFAQKTDDSSSDQKIQGLSKDCHRFWW